jgi:RNA polymerase sigma factor (sigma-70 family)
MVGQTVKESPHSERSDKIDDATAQHRVAESDRALLQRLQAGDEAAWSEFVTAADAEDALSETRLAAVRALPAFDGGVPTISFLYSIAYRKVADFWRKRSATVELLETLPAANVGDVSLEFMDALDSLPEQLRQALLLRYHVGLSVSEVAEVMDRSYKGAESLLSRARTQLREALTRAGIEHG